LPKPARKSSSKKWLALTDVKNQIGILAVEVAEKVLRKNLASDTAQRNTRGSW
jgi:F0F1-type ATP synthase membrane subunit b/b'